MEFDAARVAVLSGDPGEVVARFPGVVCVARCPEPELLRRLLRLCSDAAGPDPGRALARSLARWLSGEDDLPDRIVFGTIAPAGEQLAVFLSGAAAAEVGDTVLSGTDAAAWTDRLVTAPDGPIRLALHGTLGHAGSVSDVLDLRAGVVPGGGAVLQSVGPLGGRSIPSRSLPHEVRRPVSPLDRSPLAPDPLPRAHGNGVAPALDVRMPVSPEPSRSPLSTLTPPTPPAPVLRSVPAPPAPQPEHTVAEERADEPGADEEFSPGEWFGATGTEAPEPAVAPDQRSPWVAPPPPAPPAPASGQPGRHAVHSRSGPVEGVNGAVAASAEEPATPRAGSEVMVATPPEVAPEQVTQAAPVPTAVPEREPAGPVPAPRSAPAEPVTARNGHQSAEALTHADPPEVQGHLCPRGHLNDPRSQFCNQCGARINEQGALVSGPRPTLGVLVFDDGASYTVDAEYLVGRMPESDQRVSAGELRSIVVEDRSGAVSRVHAEIRIDGWDVLLADTGSRNGTFVAGPTQQGWSPLQPGRSRRLVPGTRVRMGGRTFVFESPGGAQ
ncbi:FHA domain-containing protein [Pseudonocardia sp. CA-107938]|uniref:FHA domain-containing protein n=1 Tax=Pseudonocardia sp. CA-107938 TaxID=3240021 RepID=UPI003D8E0065